LEARAAALLKDNSYAEGEPDRVVLFVSLKAERDGKPVFHETWAMDAWGDVRGTAMGRLVSVPVSLAVEAVLTREIPAGVHGAPHDPRLLARWLDQVGHLAQYHEPDRPSRLIDPRACCRHSRLIFRAGRLCRDSAPLLTL
jgi:hypothetical protein